MSELRPVSINFSPEAWSVVRDIADERGLTAVQVIRDAIAFEKWYQDLKADGARVLVERGDRLLELVRP